VALSMPRTTQAVRVWLIIVGVIALAVLVFAF
jgi:hypothetical protein